MADPDDPALAATRLEEALERIAALADALVARQADPSPADDAAQGVDTQAVAERLDALIARLRAALASRPA